jgi:uncharacterized protein (DUF2235 family)
MTITWNLAFALLATTMIVRRTGAMENEPVSRRVPRRLVLCLDGTWNNPFDELYQ